MTSMHINKGELDIHEGKDPSVASTAGSDIPLHAMTDSNPIYVSLISELSPSVGKALLLPENTRGIAPIAPRLYPYPQASRNIGETN